MESPLERMDKLHKELRGIQFQCRLSEYIAEGMVFVTKSPSDVFQVISRSSLTSDQIIAAVNKFLAAEAEAEARRR